jgi:hypothetical protein
MFRTVFINILNFNIMANSKAVKKGKAKDTLKASSSKKSKVTDNHSVELNKEEIRQKAEQIYYGRIDRGEQGTELSDWLQAEAMLRDADY